MESSITVRISPEEKEKLKEIAKENDLTVSQVVRKAIKEMLKK